MESYAVVKNVKILFTCFMKNLFDKSKVLDSTCNNLWGKYTCYLHIYKTLLEVYPRN